jgi:hypothetical protein
MISKIKLGKKKGHGKTLLIFSFLSKFFYGEHIDNTYMLNEKYLTFMQNRSQK